MATFDLSTEVGELCVLSAALTEAVNEAKAIVAQRGVCAEFRNLTRYASEILDDFSAKMTVIAPLEDEDMHEFSNWAERASEHLDALAAMPYTTLH